SPEAHSPISPMTSPGQPPWRGPSVVDTRRSQKYCGSMGPRGSGTSLNLAPARHFLYDPAMALIVFLRGVNVGGHRTFRPSILAKELSAYDVANVGAAGTFVVRKPGSRAKFRAELLRKLPFEAEIMFCDGRDLICLEMENPFG